MKNVLARYTKLKHEVVSDQAAAVLVLAEVLAELLQQQPQVEAQAVEPPAPTSFTLQLPPLPAVELQAVKTDEGNIGWKVANWPTPKLHVETLNRA